MKKVTISKAVDWLRPGPDRLIAEVIRKKDKEKAKVKGKDVKAKVIDETIILKKGQKGDEKYKMLAKKLAGEKIKKTK